jgi:shikimate dehydrogenase
LIAAARRAGAEVVDGLEILVAQGAISFELWTGRAAPVDAMRMGAAAR